MCNSLFEEILVDTIWHICKPFVIMWVIILVLLVYNIIYRKKTGKNEVTTIWGTIFSTSNKAKGNQKYTLKQLIAGRIIVLVIIPVYLLFQFVLPMQNDITNCQYIQVEGVYTHKTEDKGMYVFSNGCVYIETDDTIIRLDLPKGWSEKEFPLGTYYGTIYYAKDTQIALGFKATNY